MRPLIIGLSAVSLALSACQSPNKITALERPLTAQTVGPAYAEYVFTKVDVNKDSKITRKEWLTAGGTARSFASLNEDKNGSLTKVELIEVTSTDRFLAFAKKHADVNKDDQLTPTEFRSASGVRLLSFEY